MRRGGEDEQRDGKGKEGEGSSVNRIMKPLFLGLPAAAG